MHCCWFGPDFPAKFFRQWFAMYCKANHGDYIHAWLWKWDLVFFSDGVMAAWRVLGILSVIDFKLDHYHPPPLRSQPLYNGQMLSTNPEKVFPQFPQFFTQHRNVTNCNAKHRKKHLVLNFIKDLFQTGCILLSDTSVEGFSFNFL